MERHVQEGTPHLKSSEEPASQPCRGWKLRGGFIELKCLREQTKTILLKSQLGLNKRISGFIKSCV